jgi:hypothetical protein
VDYITAKIRVVSSRVLRRLSSIALAIASIDGFPAIAFVSPLPTPLSPPRLTVIHGCRHRLG